MRYVYTAIFEPKENGEGYLVSVPDVPGCITSGKSTEDAMNMVRDALAGCLCEYEDHNIELTPPRLPGDFAVNHGFAALIDVDTTQYRALTDTRSVRRNVSLPAWMDTQAERAGLSLSQVLQEALRDRLGTV